jgi:hypothetical protein
MAVASEAEKQGNREVVKPWRETEDRRNSADLFVYNGRRAASLFHCFSVLLLDLQAAFS